MLEHVECFHPGIWIRSVDQEIRTAVPLGGAADRLFDCVHTEGQHWIFQNQSCLLGCQTVEHGASGEII